MRRVGQRHLDRARARRLEVGQGLAERGHDAGVHAALEERPGHADAQPGRAGGEGGPEIGHLDGSAGRVRGVDAADRGRGQGHVLHRPTRTGPTWSSDDAKATTP